MKITSSLITAVVIGLNVKTQMMIVMFQLQMQDL